MRQLSNALTYPMESDEWLTTVVIGGVLTFLSFLIVPMFLVYGYLVRVIRGADEPEPPAFEDWGDLLVDGIQVFVIGLVFMLVPLVVAGVTVGGAIIAIATGTDAGIAAGIGGILVGLGLSFLLFLAFGYVAVAGVVNFAREERFGAAFDVDVISSVVLHRDYAVAWVVGVVVVVVAGAVAGMLNVVPLLGTVIGAFVTFYAVVVAFVLWSDGFSDVRDGPAVPDRAGVEEPAA